VTAASTGSPTHTHVLAIALPMSMAYVSTSLLGIVDTIVIGQLGEASLIGGIAVGAVVFSVLFTTFNFLRSGTTGVTAQALGAGNSEEVRASLLRALIIALIAGLAMAALSAPVGRLGAVAMGGSEAVNAAMLEYFTIRVYAAPVTLANFAMLGWFLGLGRAGAGLALQVVLNGLNMVLSAWFVLQLGWGVGGVAWGSVAAEIATLILGAGLVTRYADFSRGPEWSRVLETARFARLFALNRDIMIRSLALLLVFAFFTAQGARQGDTVLAANAILMHFFTIGANILDGFATAAEQMVGYAIGARRRRAVIRTVQMTYGWCLGLGAVLSALLFVTGPVIIDLMTVNDDVRQVAREYLFWVALTPLVGATAFEFDGVFIGATWSAEMRNMAVLSLLVSGPVWWFAMPAYGNDGLWLSLHFFLASRGLSLMVRFPRCLATTFPAR